MVAKLELETKVGDFGRFDIISIHHSVLKIIKVHKWRTVDGERGEPTKKIGDGENENRLRHESCDLLICVGWWVISI